jgi:hypothetical protein
LLPPGLHVATLDEVGVIECHEAMGSAACADGRPALAFASLRTRAGVHVATVERLTGPA